MALPQAFTFFSPVRMVYGEGKSAALPDCVRQVGGTKPLVVTDPGVAASGALEPVFAAFERAGMAYSLVTEVEPNPTVANVHGAAARYEADGCDAIVGIGGGSAMDAAKGAGIVVANGGNILDYKGRDQVKNELPPLILAPTTCGTGSEVTFNVVITDEASKTKVGFVDEKVAADIAVLDPTLLLTLPAHVVAATGMDALCHALESYVNLITNPVIDALNLAAMEMIVKNIYKAVAHGEKEALSQMLLASAIAGVAFNMNGNTIVHALSTPVTARFGVPHGIANAVLLPPVMAFNLIGYPERFARIAAIFGEAVNPKNPMEAAEKSVEHVRAMLARLDIPKDFKAWGVTEEAIPDLIEGAVVSRNVAMNPRRVSKEQMEQLYRQVI